MPKPKNTKFDSTTQIERLKEAARAAGADCLHENDKNRAFIEGQWRPLPEFLLGKPSPSPPPGPPELTEDALAYDQMTSLRALMGDRSPLAYKRACDEQLETLIIKIKELAKLDEDAAAAIGMRLHVLKRRMPPGIKWGAYLKDVGMPWGASRADDYIRVFLGKASALQIKQEAAERARKSRAKRTARHGEPIIDFKRKIRTGKSTDDVHALMSDLFEFFAVFQERARS